MKPIVYRILALLGGALLVGSIFLPRPGERGTLGWELGDWCETLELTLEAEGVPLREIAPVVGLVMGILYVPLVGVCALLVALLPSRAWRSEIVAGVLLTVHTVFLGLIIALGVAAIVIDDRWFPMGAYWGMAIGGSLTLASAWLLTLLGDPARRLCRVQLPTLGVLAVLFAAVSIWLAVQERHSWSPWGLAASSAGSLLAWIGTWRMVPAES